MRTFFNRTILASLSRVISLSLILVAIPVGEVRAGTLYESYDGFPTDAVRLTPPSIQAQSFTVLSDHTVTAVSVVLGRTGGDMTGRTLTASIRACDPITGPTGADLVTGTLAADSVPFFQWSTINFPSSLSVTSGATYALVLSVNEGSNGNLEWAVDDYNHYAGGSEWQNKSGEAWIQMQSSDFLFKVWGEAASSTQAPSITLHPFDQTVNAGENAAFSAAAVGDPVPTVQWQVRADAGSKWVDIVGATSTTYSLLTALTDNGKQYRAVFTNTAGSAASNAATLRVIIGSFNSLVDYINALVNSRVLSRGTGTSLMAKLNTSQNNFEKKNVVAGVNVLSAFRNEVVALAASGTLSSQIAGQLINGSAVQAAARLKNLGYSANTIADMLLSKFGTTAQQTAQILKDVGFNIVEITEAINETFHPTVEEMVEILMPNGFSLHDIVQVIIDVLGATYDDIARIAKNLLGYNVVQAAELLAEWGVLAVREGPAALWKALKDHYAPTASELAQLMINLSNAGRELAAQWLKDAGYTAPETAQALTDVFNATASEVADCLKNIFGSGAQASAQILKDIGFPFWDIVSALVDAFLIALDEAFSIVTAIFG